MNIGQASKASGVSLKMIRYYESIGLIRPAERTSANYRDFSERDVNELRFIHRARKLGFGMKTLAQLLSLWRDRSRSSRTVKAVAEEHIGELERRIAELREMVETLKQLSDACHGDERPDCPILGGLSNAIGGGSREDQAMG